MDCMCYIAIWPSDVNVQSEQCYACVCANGLMIWWLREQQEQILD